jgi:spore maturation protein CgeB
VRFLILDTHYPEFLRWFYDKNEGLEHKPYEEQLRVRDECPFGIAGFYARNLRKLGHEAFISYADNDFMQKAWAREKGLQYEEPSPSSGSYKNFRQRCIAPFANTPLRRLKPIVRPLLGRQVDRSWFNQILAAQIECYRPDVLINLAISQINCRFLKDMKSHVKLLIGQHAATQLSDSEEWNCYDVVISSFPPTVEWFRRKRIPVEYFRLGFEQEVLSQLGESEEVSQEIPVSFTGSFHKVHSSRVRWLEKVCEYLDKSGIQVRVWGAGVDTLPKNSLIRKSYVGPAWGLDMFLILRASKVTLNHHGDVAPYANNSRLFEATGMGTLLITDWKENLHDLFEPGREVLAYHTAEECADLIQYYLEHEEERQAIARAGYERTLSEHTYYHRMQELVAILDRYLDKAQAGSPGH